MPVNGNTLEVGQYRKPVLLVARIHPAAQDARVDLRKQIKRVLPRPYPVHLSVGPLDEAVHRHLQGRNQLSHAVSSGSEAMQVVTEAPGETDRGGASARGVVET
jgi:hypothetical protein